LAGAAAGAAVALSLSGLPAVVVVVLALAASAVGGAGWASIAAFLRARFAVLEVISTIMLNFLALHGVSYLVRGPLQEPTHVYPQSSTIADAIHLPRIVGAGRLHGGLLLALGAGFVAGWVLRRTAAGFRLIAAGESPSAATSAGDIDVMVTTTLAFLTSGALAGLAGGVEVLGVTFALYENISPGYGYTAIAVALLARLDPWRVVATALLFGGLEAGAGAMQRDAGVPSTLVTVIEAALILAVVAVGALRRRSSLPDTTTAPIVA
jgi:simple sugar transport system permease protein